LLQALPHSPDQKEVVMKTHDDAKVHSDSRYSPEAVRCFAALAALTQLTCVVNELKLREDCLTVASPPKQTPELDFAGRQPFGFAFTEGHQATFNVPSGYRLVIEHINIACWAENHPHLFVQLVTKSPHMFRNLTLCTSAAELARADSYPALPAAEIQIQGLTTNTFLFSDGELKNSSTVPPDTYVQVWGYLERSSFPDSF
jgi:hypothetical protein